MSTTSLAAATSLYEASRNLDITYHSVKYSEFELFSRSVSTLKRRIHEAALGDQYWDPVLGRLIGLRTRLTVAPHSSATVRKIVDSTLNWFESYLQGYEYSYPNLVTEMKEILGTLENVPAPAAEEMLLQIVSLLREVEGRTAVVLLKARHITDTQLLLDERAAGNSIEVFNPTALREDETYKRLVLVGPPRWFPEYVFTAPRSADIHVVNFKWLGNSWKRQATFAHPVKSSRLASGFEDSETISDFDLELPEVDFSNIARMAAIDVAATASEELEEARIYLLEAGWATFLEADLDSSVTIIDLDENDENRVRTTKIKYLEPGMFILLRTEGGGDYILAVADQIMGTHASYARQLQTEWKRRLRRAVSELGFDETVHRLRQFGAARASGANLANWLSARNIKTRDLSDFRAIMRLVGLGDEFDKYWGTMSKIVEAHRRAGHYIRQLLLQRVFESNLSVLNRVGTMTFELGEVGAGSLTAFRILSVSSGTVQVASWRIGEAFKVEDEQWL